jgi:hypothetical protein
MLLQQPTDVGISNHTAPPNALLREKLSDHRAEIVIEPSADRDHKTLFRPLQDFKREKTLHGPFEQKFQLPAAHTNLRRKTQRELHQHMIAERHPHFQRVRHA